MVLFLGGWYYTTTADFQRRVGAEVVSVLEDSTGGRVELGHISFSLLHLAVEADGLVIHGTEGPGEAPYISAAKIFIRLKINTFLSHTVGKGAQSHIGLEFSAGGRAACSLDRRERRNDEPAGAEENELQHGADPGFAAGFAGGQSRTRGWNSRAEQPRDSVQSGGQ